MISISTRSVRRAPRGLSRLIPLGAAGLLLAVSVSGCGSGVIPGPVAQPSPEGEALRRKAIDMEQRAIMGEVEAKRLRAEVKRLKVELAEVKEQAQRTAPRAASSEPIGDGVGAVELAPRIESTELEDPTPSEGSSADGGSGTSAQEIYDQGYALFHRRSYTQAELAFSQVLEHHADHELADNALFWIGESRYAQGDFAAALTAFTSTVERYPEGNKVGDAMLKAGKCLESLGQVDRAIRTYEELRTLFPETVAAILAEERLSALR